MDTRPPLRLLSAGAAQGLLRVASGPFAAATGVVIDGAFGAVGIMRQRLEDGEPCDVVILTSAQIDALVAARRVIESPVRPLGSVATGVAVRSSDAIVDVGDSEALGIALRAADAIYMPDQRRSTAGIHFAGVLRRLGIDPAVDPRLREFRNGATAMAALANARDEKPIGCTQVTEIRDITGVTLVGLLPRGLGLVTVYSAAVCTTAADPQSAGALVALLGGPVLAAARLDAGFT